VIWFAWQLLEVASHGPRLCSIGKSKKMEKNTFLDIDFWKNSKAFFGYFNQQTDLIIELFTDVCNAFPQNKLEAIFPNAKGCKVTKGNQLEGLPYQVLDLVRDFDAQHGFNIRILNWWGNGFFVFITYGSSTAKLFQQVLCTTFDQYNISILNSPFDYGKILNHSEILNDKNLNSVIEGSNQLQIWKKLDISDDIKETKSILGKMIQSILDIHT
jgi:hypothetical protein